LSLRRFGDEATTVLCNATCEYFSGGRRCCTGYVVSAGTDQDQFGFAGQLTVGSASAKRIAQLLARAFDGFDRELRG
jgi:hypothetical protein